ncbi:MAG: DsbA family protein [Patescibacteria group bacterium]|nr:DsbA family protein [Patescibacteria group bacterium]
MAHYKAIAITAGIGMTVILIFGFDIWRNREQAKPRFDFSGALRPSEFKESPVRGAANPVVTIFEYADFECSHCAEYQAVIGRVLAKYPDRVRVVWKDFPFVSVASKDAAIAARCANEQNMFWQYQGWLFANQGSLGTMAFKEGAAEFGLSDARFTECLSNATIHSLVERDFAEGQALGITETPTLVIGDVALVGARPFEEVERVLVPLLQNGN